MSTVRALPVEQPIIVAMTGDTTEKTREKCEREGFACFFTKPVRIIDIVELFKNLPLERV